MPSLGFIHITTFTTLPYIYVSYLAQNDLQVKETPYPSYDNDRIKLIPYAGYHLTIYNAKLSVSISNYNTCTSQTSWQNVP